jgi:hypothetical protein
MRTPTVGVGHLTVKSSHAQSALLDRLRWFVNDMRYGRNEGFPFCCRLRYSLEEAILRDPEPAVWRGLRFNELKVEYVPCGIFHQATLTHREHEHLINIRALQWRS